jgi:hypothetical protein
MFYIAFGFIVKPCHGSYAKNTFPAFSFFGDCHSAPTDRKGM